jgi:hypothetical protein
MNEELSGANALLLLGALIKAGAQPDEDMANARITELAIAAGLEGGDLTQALEYAGGQGWMDSGARPGWTRVTAAGIAAGQGNG